MRLWPSVLEFGRKLLTPHYRESFQWIFPKQYLHHSIARIWDFKAKWGQDLGLNACTECGKVGCRKQPSGLLDWDKIWVGIHAWRTLFGTLYKNWNTETGTCPLLCLLRKSQRWWYDSTYPYPYLHKLYNSTIAPTFCNSFPESYQYPFPGDIGMLMFTAMLNHYCFQKGSQAF